MAAAKPADFDVQMEEFEGHLRLIRNRGEPLGEFADEYENMVKTLRKYEDTKVRLLAKQKSVETSISSRKEKSNAAAAVLEDIKSKQERMKGEIARFNEERVKITERVAAATAEIATVTADVNQLQKLLETGPGLTPQQVNELKVLKDRKDQLQRERDAYTGQLVNLRMGTKQQADILISEQEAKVAIAQNIGELRKQHAEIKLETRKAQRRKDKLDVQLQQMNKEVDELKQRIQVEADESVTGAAELEDKENKFRTVSASVAAYVFACVGRGAPTLLCLWQKRRRGRRRRRRDGRVYVCVCVFGWVGGASLAESEPYLLPLFLRGCHFCLPLPRPLWLSRPGFLVVAIVQRQIRQGQRRPAEQDDEAEKGPGGARAGERRTGGAERGVPEGAGRARR
jgi:chromosome segregation ATPase